MCECFDVIARVLNTKNVYTCNTNYRKQLQFMEYNYFWYENFEIETRNHNTFRELYYQNVILLIHFA